MSRGIGSHSSLSWAALRHLEPHFTLKHPHQPHQVSHKQLAPTADEDRGTSPHATQQPGAWPPTRGCRRDLLLSTRPRSHQVAAHEATTSCFPTKIKFAITTVVGKALPCLCRPRLNSEQKLSLVYLFNFGTEEWLGSKPVPFSSCSLFSGLSNTPYPSPRPPTSPSPFYHRS